MKQATSRNQVHQFDRHHAEELHLTSTSSGVEDESRGSSSAPDQARTIGYLVNQYPSVSHSFIRREIIALERLGLAVERFALRGWDANVVDPDDIAERQRTRYVLQAGLISLGIPIFRAFTGNPLRFLSALWTALRMSMRSDRSIVHHLVYFAEACQLLDWTAKSGCSHLHAHFGTNPADIALLVRRLGGPPYSLTVHGPDEFDRSLQLGLREKVAEAKFVVAISSYTRSQLFRRAAPGDWSKIHIVHCGLERGFYEGHEAVEPAGNQFVCIGRLSEAKGHLILLEAMALATRSGADCRLVLAGDGELRPVIEDHIRKLGLAGRVTITGWIDSATVRKHILASRALVLPSFQEGLPVVIMEAMALGRPVIATSVSGIPELVRPGETGWLIAPGSALALSMAIVECCSVTSEHLHRMGQAGRSRVITRHAIDVEAAKLIKLIAENAPADRISEWQP